MCTLDSSDQGMNKLNTHGFAQGNPTSAKGERVLRNKWGSGIKGFQRWIKITNRLVAELWVIQDGLTMETNMGVQVLHVESDA